MIEKFTQLVVSRLELDKESLKTQFQTSAKQVGTRYFFVDDLLPEELTRQIYEKFPGLNEMRLMSSFREKKYTSKDFDKFDSILKEMTYAIQQPQVIKVVEEITGIQQQLADPSLYAGGLSAMSRGHFLNPHIDNSHDGGRQNYRTVNLLFYVSPNWKDENGGHLELWDRSVKKNVTLHSRFNRLVVMETNPWSWHSVCEVKVNRPRCCVSNYYFSPRSPLVKDYFHVTEFSGRPDEPVKRMISMVDNALRMGLRKIVKGGLGKKDVYQGAKSN